MLSRIDVAYENDAGLQYLELPILGLSPQSSFLLFKVTGITLVMEVLTKGVGRRLGMSS
jgi:hypothetical protein